LYALASGFVNHRLVEAPFRKQFRLKFFISVSVFRVSGEIRGKTSRKMKE
jgi:hypothetical protein